MDSKDQVSSGSQSGSFISRCWLKLTKHLSAEAEVDFYFFKAHPKTAIGWIIVCTLVCIVIGGGIAIPHFYHKWTTPPVEPSILVVCPDPTRASEGAFYQDGAVQQKGFNAARIEAESFPGKLKVKYHHMKGEETADEILQAMQDSYAKEGGTFFVMTMSGKLRSVRDHFKRWHNECVTNPCIIV